jgi:RimJ/RimL family protein N-acetyltransferase
MIIAETAHLIIRPFAASDLEPMTRVFGNVEVMRFGDGVQSAEWVRDWLSRCLESYEQRGYGPWAVVEKDSGETIGYCGLFYFSDINGRPEIEIGYRLARAFWGQGYATEAVTAARDYAFHALGLTRLIAMIDPGNVASIRVAEKAGLRYEADVMLPGYTHPDRVYTIESG